MRDSVKANLRFDFTGFIRSVVGTLGLFIVFSFREIVNLTIIDLLEMLWNLIWKMGERMLNSITISNHNSRIDHHTHYKASMRRDRMIFDPFLAASVIGVCPLQITCLEKRFLILYASNSNLNNWNSIIINWHRRSLNMICESFVYKKEFSTSTKSR